MKPLVCLFCGKKSIAFSSHNRHMDSCKDNPVRCVEDELWKLLTDNRSPYSMRNKQRSPAKPTDECKALDHVGEACRRTTSTSQSASSAS